MITKEKAIELIKDVMHPAINRSLLDLGIVKYITIDENIVYVTFAFPFPNIPIAETLIQSISEPLEKAGTEVRVDMLLMTEDEKKRFLEMEHEAWKGLDE